VHTGGTGANNVSEGYSLGSYSTSPILDDAAVHTAKIEYQEGSLSVYLDNLNSPVLTIAIDLANTLALNSGDAWLGFTAATGGGYQTHDILNWSVQAATSPATRIAIADLSQAEGNAATSDFVFTVTRAGEISGETTVDWTTFDGTAQSGDDYVADSGTRRNVETDRYCCER
jgi:hypothetical protein